LELHFLGGAQEVGASCLYLDMDGSRYLVDAGIRMGGRDPLPNLAALDRLDAVLVTHAHMDHIGALPLVHQAYPHVPVYATAPTVHLMRVLLADALKLMALKAEQEMECPLYDGELVARLFTRVVPVPPGNTVPLPGGASATFFPAGHILGAAMIELVGTEGRVLVTGDVHSLRQRTIGAMILPSYRPDLIVMESTYGNRLHADRELEETKLGREVARTVVQGGKVLIPAFALGRAQEIILLLQALQTSGRIPRFPVFVDGLVRSVCQCYLNFPEYLNRPLAAVIKNGGSPFYRSKGPVQAVNTAAQRDKILAGPPACIVSSSGMLAGGPSQYYAEKLVGDAKNAILFCGYQDEESPGRRLLEMAQAPDNRTITLGERTLQVACRIAQYGLSAHADAGALSSLVEKLQPQAVVLVHGDAGSRAALAQMFAGRPFPVFLPDNGDCLPFRFGRSTVKTSAPRARGLGDGGPVDLHRVWTHVQKTAPQKLYTGEDIAAIWYGGVPPGEQNGTVDRLLQEDVLYFSSDWKHPYFYRARRPDEVALTEKRLALMAARGSELPGKLVLLRDCTGHIRVGYCYGVTDQDMEVLISGQDGTRHGVEELLAVIGPWECASVPMDTGAEKTRLHRFLVQMRPVFKKLKPDLIWPVLQEKGPLDIDRLTEELCLDPADPAHRVALLWRLNLHGESFAAEADMWRAAGDGPGDTEQAECDVTELMEQNSALSVIRDTLPPEAGLYRQGVNREKGEITLYFNFPRVVQSRFATLLDGLAAETGWRIRVHPEANQSALMAGVYEIVPWPVVKTPALHREKGLVAVECDLPAGTATAGVERLFLETTGFRLLINAVTGTPPPPLAAPVDGQRMEINRAYAVVREGLALAGARVYKTGLKNKAIEITFITPQVGHRYRETLAELSRKTGWPLVVREHPNQNDVKNLVKRLVPHEWALLREPGFHQDTARVRVKLGAGPADDDPKWLELVETVRRETGYELIMDRQVEG